MKSICWQYISQRIALVVLRWLFCITTCMTPSWNLYIGRNTLQKTSCFTFLFSVFLVCRIIRYICLPIMNDFSTFKLSRQSSTRPYLLESRLLQQKLLIHPIEIESANIHYAILLNTCLSKDCFNCKKRYIRWKRRQRYVQNSSNILSRSNIWY